MRRERDENTQEEQEIDVHVGVEVPLVIPLEKCSIRNTDGAGLAATVIWPCGPYALPLGNLVRGSLPTRFACFVILPILPH